MQDGHTRTALAGWIVSVAAVALAALARWLLDPLLGERLPYVSFFIAVAVAAWYGGLQPALVATAGGFAVAAYFFIAPRLTLRIDQMSAVNQLGLATYFAVAGSIAALGEALHRAQRRAERRREALHVTLRSIGDAVLTTDLESRVTSMNTVAEQLTGWSEGDAASRPLDEVFRIVNETTRATVANPAARVLEQGIVVGPANHTVLIARDGSERPIDDSAAPIRDRSGELLGVVLVFRDVSEKKRADEALRRWQHIFDHAAWPVAVADAATGALDALNPAFAGMHGYRVDELHGQPLATVFAPADRALLAERAQAANQHGELRYESLHVRKDGTQFPVLTHASAFRDASGRVAFRAATFTDLSELRAAEQALRAGEARKSAMLAAAFDAVVTIDASGTVLDFNPAAERLFGYTRGEALGREMAELIVPPVLRAAHRAGMRRHLHDGTTRVLNRLVELTAMRAGGAQFSVELAITAVAGAEPPLFVGYLRDISERKRIEGELRAARSDLEARVAERTAELAHSNRFLQALLESVDDGIVACDANGVLGLFNRATREWHGLPEEPLPAEQWASRYDLYRADGRTPMQPAEVPLYRALAGERVRDVQMVIAPKIGPARTLLASGQPFHDDSGQLLGAVVSMHDVTEQRRAEAALRVAHGELERRIGERTVQLEHSNELLRAQIVERERAEQAAARAAARLELISDTVPALISYVDRERRYRLNNRAYESWFGHPRGAVTGRPMREVLGEAAWQVVEPHIDAALDGQEQTYDAEVPYRDGGTRWVRATYTPSVGADGKIEGVVMLVIDITESKRVERALQDADRRKDEFLATLAHELRNPLAPLRTGLQVLRLTGGGDERTEHVRSMMERQLAHMVRLLDDLLDVSRISRGSFELRLERLLLADVVQHALETCTPFIEERGHALAVSLPPRAVALRGDQARLSQAICNLLTNAARYTEPGGRIALTARVQGGQASVSVRDSGIGVAAERLPRLFEMFTRSARGQSIEQQGLGIGLSIVKRLIELHGGTVEAKSDGPGQGSEFVLRLPLGDGAAAGDAPAAPAASDAAGPAVAGERRRVLVVDDNRDAADSLALMLAEMGHDTRTAYSGLQALDAAAAFDPQIVFMDIGMPGLSGHETARRLRQAPTGATPPLLVAVTGWGQAEDRLRSAEAGFDVHLVKPIDPANLRDVLRPLPPGTAPGQPRSPS